MNASLGGYGTSAVINTAMATYPNTLYVIAAGNSGTDNDVQPVTPCVDEPGERPLRRRLHDQRHEGVVLELRREHGRPLRARPGDPLDVPHARRTSSSTAPRWPPRTSPAPPRSSPRISALRGSALAERIKATVDHPAALSGLSVTGGRLNAARAVGAATDAPTRPVVLAAQAGRDSATLTMSTREADLASYHVYDAATGAYVTSATAPTITIGGLAAGTHQLVVVARNTSGQDSPTSAIVSVVIPAASTSTGGATTTEKPAGTATHPGDDEGLRLPAGRRADPQPPRPADAHVPRHPHRAGHVHARQAQRRTRYRTTATKTLRLVPGLQSLPITSRLLGMRVPKGAWRVTLSSGTSPTATVAFTRR